MKRSLWIRIVAYPLAATLLVALWVQRSGTAPIPVVLHQSDDDYYAGQGPTLDRVIAAKARTITDVSVETRLPQTPIFLGLSSDGRLRREVTTLSDYSFYARSTAVKRVETSEAQSSAFPQIAYLVARLDLRLLPDSELGWWARELEVSFQDGTRRRYVFMNEPPELWAIFESLLRINDTAKWPMVSRTEGPLMPPPASKSPAPTPAESSERTHSP